MAAQPAAFRTKVDFWLAAVLVLALLGVCVAVAASFYEDAATGWLLLALTALPVLLVAALSLPTVYVVTADALVVRFGLFRVAIPFGAIERVYPTRNPLSAPAWSLHRLGIGYRKGGRRRLMLISPADREAFLALLTERAGLEREGAELRRPVPSCLTRALSAGRRGRRRGRRRGARAGGRGRGS